MNKQQRSSTFSSPVDTYQYSADSADNAQFGNHQKIEDTPFQKLRGHSIPSFHSKKDSINSSPFQDNGSQVGIPISYLNITHNPQQAPSSINNSNYNQLNELYPGSLQERFISFEDQDKKIITNKESKFNKVLNYDNQHSQSYKKDEMNSNERNRDINKGIGYGKGFSNKSEGENSFGQIPRVLQINSHLTQIDNHSQKLSSLGYESPLLPRNLSSTDCQTAATIENRSTSITKQPSNIVSMFSPSPQQQQTKQQQILQETANKQYEYQISQYIQQNVLQQQREKDKQGKSDDSIYFNRSITNPNTLYNSTLQNLQNENIMIPKLQSSEPSKLGTVSNPLISNTTFNTKINNNNNNSSQGSIANKNNHQNNLSNTNLSTFGYGNNTSYIKGNSYNQGNSNNNNSNNTSLSNNFILGSNLSNQQQPTPQIENNYRIEEDSQQIQHQGQPLIKKQFTFQQQQSLQLENNDELVQKRIKSHLGELISSNQNTEIGYPKKTQSQFQKYRNLQHLIKDESNLITLENINETSLQEKTQINHNQSQQSFQPSTIEINNQILQMNTTLQNRNEFNQKFQFNENNYFKETETNDENNDNQQRKNSKNNQNQRQFNTEINDKATEQQSFELQRLNSIVKEYEVTIINFEREMSKIESERNHLQDFVRNIETRNKLLNERIQLLESNLQSLNTQNIDNIDKIVKLNDKLQISENNLQQKSKQNFINSGSSELKEAVLRQERIQAEMQQLIQKDLNQEKKILELMADLNKLQSIRNDFEKSMNEQEILVKDNQNYQSAIEQQKNEIKRLQNIIVSSHQDLQTAILQQEMAVVEKRKAENQVQKLTEQNKNLEDCMKVIKTSYQQLEQTMMTNCSETKRWLEKYTALEVNYLNLKNQQRGDFSNQLIDKNSSSNRDLQLKSQQSLNKFRSELSETELTFQHQRNQELILSEIQGERDQLGLENEELKQNIKELSIQNTQNLVRIQNLQLSNQNQFEQNEKQKSEFMQSINIMIQENNKLIAANQERPYLLQKVQQLTAQLEFLKAQHNLQQEMHKPISMFNNIQESGLVMQPLPNSFNSPIEEAKWYKVRCCQLEVKLKIKSEEYADLIYQSKSMKNQKVNNQNNDEFSIKSSLYQNIQTHSSTFLKQASKFQNETPLNSIKQQNEPDEESQRGCCDKRINKTQSRIDNDSESNACSVKCI